MPPWAYALIVIAVLCAIGFSYDAVARRKRRGLEKYGSPSQHRDPAAEVEDIRGGTINEGMGIRDSTPFGM